MARLSTQPTNIIFQVLIIPKKQIIAALIWQAVKAKVCTPDAGVVVYSGWNDYGYGNMIMIDHGNGFQSLYAHLSAIYRGCGQSVGQGEGIGAVGTTAIHLVLTCILKL